VLIVAGSFDGSFLALWMESPIARIPNDDIVIIITAIPKISEGTPYFSPIIPITVVSNNRIVPMNVVVLLVDILISFLRVDIRSGARCSWERCAWEYTFIGYRTLLCSARGDGLRVAWLCRFLRMGIRAPR